MPGNSPLQLLEPLALPSAHKGATSTPKMCQSLGSAGEDYSRQDLQHKRCF